MESTIILKEEAGLVSISGLNDDQIDALTSALAPAAQGYKVLSKQSFSQQKATFYELQPELKSKSNSQLRAEIEKQLGHGKMCLDILGAIEGWRKEQNDKETDDWQETTEKVISLNKE